MLPMEKQRIHLVIIFFLKEEQPSSASKSPLKKSFKGKDSLSFANILHSRNKFVDALSVYDGVLENDSENVEAHIGKGICLQMQSMGRLAYESFAEAIRLEPQNSCAHTHCGILCKDEGRLVEAAEITPRVLQVWARILCAVPNSRLIVKCKPFGCDSVRQQFLSKLEKLGLESLHVDLLPLIVLNHDHLQAYSLMDISLDTFPYAGTTTTCESLYMGVPCVTMRGSVHAHNVGVSLLNRVGLSNLVAKNEDEYVQQALQLALDITALSNLRTSLWDLMLKSPLCDGSKFTQGLQSTYRDMWRRYCKGDVPSLRHMEIEQLHSPRAVSEELAIQFANPTNINIPIESPAAPIKANGFILGQS